jgi:hypothetical protein
VPLPKEFCLSNETDCNVDQFIPYIWSLWLGLRSCWVSSSCHSFPHWIWMILDDFGWCLWFPSLGNPQNRPIGGKFRVRSYRVESASQSSVRNQHPKVRISVAESVSKTILDQHRGWIVGMVGMVGVTRKVAIYNPPDPIQAI